MSDYQEAKEKVLKSLHHELGHTRCSLDVNLFNEYKQAAEIMIGHLEVQNSDLAGHILGKTCMMCNLWERADCFDQRTDLEKEIATKDAELARLREELEAWKKRFPAAGYDGSEIVLSG